MAPRWIKTKGRFDAAFKDPQPDAADWLLMSGNLVIGRVLRGRSGLQAGRFSWYLTGAHGAMIRNHGITATLEQAQADLMASWRRWQEWAGMRDN